MNNQTLIQMHVAMARGLNHQAVIFSRLGLSAQRERAQGKAFCAMNAARRLKADACR